MKEKTSRAFFIVLCAIIILIENIIDYKNGGTFLALINFIVWIIVGFIWLVIAVSETINSND